MRIVVVGATGIIGQAVTALLAADHDVIRVARSRADITTDVVDPDAVSAMYEAVGAFDALVCTFGAGVQGGLETLDDEAFNVGWRTKVLPQFNLVKQGLPRIADQGSFTLSSGVLSTEPMPGLSAVSATNGAVDAFCAAAALEMPRGVRINCVSPVFVEESLRAAGVTDFAGLPTQSAAATAKAYAQAVLGDWQGRHVDPRKL